MRHPKLSRHKEIQRLCRNLTCNGFPRLQMLTIVLLTGLGGFCSTALLLHWGWTVIWHRYLVAFTLAYAVFLTLLWLWLRSNGDAFDGMPDQFDLPSGGSSADVPCSDTSLDLLDAAVPDEGLIPLLGLALIGSLALLSGWLIVEAPVLFAELLVDGILSTSLYRRLRGLQTQHWLHTAVRRTCVPFILCGVIVCALGWAMQLYAPEAVSLGGVLRH